MKHEEACLGALALGISLEPLLLGGIYTPINDYGAGALDNLRCLAFTVDLAEANPLANGLVLINTVQGSLALGTQRLNKLDVGSLAAVVGKNADLAALALESLGALAETAGDTVEGSGLLEHGLNGGVGIKGHGG